MNTIKVSPTTSVGFLIGMGAWSISFITLIWGYVAYRLRLGPWLADYVDAGVWTRALMNTGLLILSAGVLAQFFRKKNPLFFWGGVVLGISFIRGQWVLWTMFLARGLTFNNSLAGSFLYLLTGFHALHVVIALSVLLLFGIPLCRPIAGERNQRRFQFALKFWDLLTVFWVGLLLLIFVFK